MTHNTLESGDSYYKASFKFESDLEEKNRKNLSNRQAMLAISIGQPYHEDRKFLATIELINKYGFKRCDIVLGDTLQRYNYYGSMLPEQARIYSKQQGDRWLERNAHSLSKLTIPHSIIRWDEFLSHKDYERNKNHVMEAYHTEEAYQQALHANVETYLARLQTLNPNSNFSSLFSWGLDYLLEECPVIMPLWAEMGYDFIIYPKPLTGGMAKTRDLFVTNKFDDKCKWLSLRFKKKSKIFSDNYALAGVSNA